MDSEQLSCFIDLIEYIQVKDRVRSVYRTGEGTCPFGDY